MIYAFNILCLVLFFSCDAFSCTLSEIENAFFQLSGRNPDAYVLILNFAEKVINDQSCSNFFMSNTRGNAFSISFDENDKKVVVFGRYESAIELPVPENLIKRGEPLDSKSVKMQKFSVSRVTRNVVSKPEFLNEKIAKRNLKPGNIILKNDVEKNYIVHRNDVIEVIYKSGSDLELRMKAIASEDGAKDEKIRFRNINSRKELVAKVQNEREAIVRKN